MPVTFANVTGEVGNIAANIVTTLAINNRDDMATLQQIQAIQAGWTGAGAPGATLNDGQTSAYFLAFAINAAHTGTSPNTTYLGGYQPNGHGAVIAFNTLVPYIKAQTTLRRFCKRFANDVFNNFINNNVDPAKWAQFGYLAPESKCGFDFAEGIDPNNPNLTPTMRMAIKANSAVNIYESSNSTTKNLSTHHEYNAGQLVQAQSSARPRGRGY